MQFFKIQKGLPSKKDGRPWCHLY